MEVEQFKNRVLERMNELGWDKAELARRAGLPKGTIYAMYNKGTSPSFETCMAIMEALDVRLVGLDKDADAYCIRIDKKVGKEQRELLDITYDTDAEKLQRIISYANFVINYEK